MSNLVNEYNKYFDFHFKGLAFTPRRDDKICKIEKLVGSNKQVLEKQKEKQKKNKRCQVPFYASAGRPPV